MRTALFAASALLAVCICNPGFAAPNNANSSAAPAASLKRKAERPQKPNFDQCYDMSTTKGFNHGNEEWMQAIQDCMDGKIPL